MKMLHDGFEAWVRDCSRGCLEPSEIDELCRGEFDFDGATYHFIDPTVQAQWEAWQAAIGFVAMLNASSSLTIGMGSIEDSELKG